MTFCGVLVDQTRWTLRALPVQGDPSAFEKNNESHACHQVANALGVLSMLVHRPRRCEVLGAVVPLAPVVPVVQLQLQEHRDRHAAVVGGEPPDQPGIALLQEHREDVVVVVPRGDVLLVEAAQHRVIGAAVARDLVPWLMTRHMPNIQ